MKITIFSFTEKGDELNGKIAALEIGETSSVVRESAAGRLGEETEKAFAASDALVFIGAAGIAVRAVAPLVKSKATDPAVIVCDELGRFVIPVLSGHIGGANSLAERIAAGINAQPVITTATDINKKWAVDVWAKEKGYKIANIEQIKYISSAVLRGERIAFSAMGKKEMIPYENIVYTADSAVKCGISVSIYEQKPFEHTLCLVPPCVTLGVGCKKGIKGAALINFFEEIRGNRLISPLSVKAVATIDIKKDEGAVLELCRYLNAPLITYTAEELNAVEGDFTPSDFVKNITGTDNVCERAAAAGGGELLLPKTRGEGVTLALAVDKEVFL